MLFAKRKGEEEEGEMKSYALCVDIISFIFCKNIFFFSKKNNSDCSPFGSRWKNVGTKKK